MKRWAADEVLGGDLLRTAGRDGRGAPRVLSYLPPSFSVLVSSPTRW